MQSSNIAKTVILSSLFTIFVTGTFLFLLRFQILSYIEANLEINDHPNSDKELIHDNDRVVSAIEKANPAVVSIIVTKNVPVYERYYETYNPLGFYGGFKIPRIRETGTEEKEVGGGSGFIVSNDGLILTNRHVVEDDEANYLVFLNDGTSYKTQVLAKDPQFDIAILKIDEPIESALPYLTFGNSDNLQLGQTVIAIGNALAEFRNSVSVGVISGLLRSVVATDSTGRSEQLDRVIQTDAAINPGNSGGPLLDTSGEVVGVNVAVSRGADNIGFALPGNLVSHVVDSVKEYGEIVRPYLGVRYVMIDESLAEKNNLPVSYGALIVSGFEAGDFAVVPGSPADIAGLMEGDIILRIDNTELIDKDLVTLLREKDVGQKVDLIVLKDGEQVKVSAVLEKTI